jgi:hypothetical protein
MSFQEIRRRLRITGFTIGEVGVDMEPPPEADSNVARRVLTFLEDRRVLYNHWWHEDIEACIRSVQQIRQFLTDELMRLDSGSNLIHSLRAMRAACRRFVDVRFSEQDMITLRAHAGPQFDDGAKLGAGLGELRQTFGYHVALIAVQYEIDVDADLASILPAYDEDDIYPFLK